MIALRALCLLPLSIAAPLFAQDAADPTAASRQGDLAVTIYNDDLALVQDVRRLAIPSGVSRIEFPYVSAQIRPETLSFAADGASIVEQNFDFDLLSPAKLMEKAVGRTITIIRTNPATGAETRERARVLGVNGGVVLQIGDRIEILRDDGLPVRAIFDEVPANLRARPTLSVTVDSARSGTRDAAIRYLTPGLGWNADYVALFDAKAGRIDVQGWVTLTNQTGTTYVNARTLLVAGSVNRADRGGYAPPRRPGVRMMGTETAEREQLGDFYLYPLSMRTTIADRQTKQVSFLDVQGVPAKAGYAYRNDWLGSAGEPQSAKTMVSFSTARTGGLGDALPAGTVRFYMKDAGGAAQFIGENRVDHMPMGSQLALATGDAFDVKVKPVVEQRERLSDRKWRTHMRYELSNAKAENVTVELTQAGLDFTFADTRIVSESLGSRREGSSMATWQVPVPANGTASVTAIFETRY
ncbi:MAG: DUF4139 domain-containing protein [Sphingobium sp.]